MEPPPVPATIDEYIAGCPAGVREVLQSIRETVRQAAPEAREAISYRMPTFMLDGVVIHFAAFKKHVGVYPPVKGDPKLDAELAPYRGEKGNLKFPLDRPMPLDLIRRIVLARLDDLRQRKAARRRKA